MRGSDSIPDSVCMFVQKNTPKLTYKGASDEGRAILWGVGSSFLRLCPCCHPKP